MKGTHERVRMKPQLEKSIKIKFVNRGWRFYKNTKMKVYNVLTNGRCTGFYKLLSLNGENEFHHWDVFNPEPGCMVFVKFDLYNQGLSAYQWEFGAFIFEKGIFRGKWKAWEHPHDIRVTVERGSADIEIAITCSNSNAKLVSIKSHDDSHRLLTFQHVLDYAAGNLSLADILALVEAEECLRLHQERQVVYGQILPRARKLKGAVRSSTGAEIERLVMELLEGKFPL